MEGRKRSWERHQIVRCCCTSLSYRHVHCPCDQCKGKAVSSSTEHSHWKMHRDLESVCNTSTSYVPGSANFSFEVSQLFDQGQSNTSINNDGNSIQNSLSDISSPMSDAACFDAQAEQEESMSEDVLESVVYNICKALMLASQMQGSLDDIEDVINFAKELFCRNDQSSIKYWPKNWYETKQLLKKYGYKEPRELYICLDASHYTQWDVMDSPDAVCHYCGKKGSIKYYYLGLKDKIRTWFSDIAMCKKMLAHWENKDNWIHGVGSNFILKEIWDGARFNELSWFWNPESEWMLPYQCTFCHSIISTEEITSSLENNGSFLVQCGECATRKWHCPTFTCGDPRNIAFIGHWDGWQPFGSPGEHSCGALEVSIANMYKKDRSTEEEVYVVGFVPSHMLPKKRPCSLDPFLHPLISEIEDIFINGYQVHYAGNYPGLPSGDFKVRTLILLWTGDYVAQCEVGKFINAGIYACRRDHLKGTIDPGGGTTYYYGQNRHHARFPWRERNLEEELQKMKEISNEDRPSVRETLSRSCGYTGLSILHRLYKLYGFDVLKDTVFDVMHNIPLNVIGIHLKDLIADEKLDAKEVDKKLEQFPWTAELKDGRLPYGLSSRLNYWKAEEFQKFCYPASEVILGRMLEPNDYQIWQCVVSMTELVFNKRNGWSIEDTLLFSKLAKKYIILLEEQRGVTACRVTVHNLMHISSDALRFSHPDNYWCFPFERAVKRYVGHSSNFKNKECSFAKRESYRELLKLVSRKFNNSEEININFDLTKMWAKSLEGAKHIQGMIVDLPEHADSFKEGVLVGGVIYNEVLLSQRDIQLILALNTSSGYILETAWFFRSLWKPFLTPQGLLFRCGEHVIFHTDGNECICEIKQFLCVGISGNTYKFMKAVNYPKMLDAAGNIVRDPCSGSILIDVSNEQLFIAPVSAILRKCILYDDDDDNSRIVIDFQREVLPLEHLDIVVPFYPQEQDMVLIEGDDPDPWLAKVLTIQDRLKTVKVLYYTQDIERQTQHLYVPYQERRIAYDYVSWNSIICLAPGCWVNNAWEMEPDFRDI